MVIPDKGVLLYEIHNGLYYHDMEDSALVLASRVEENREIFSQRELYGARGAWRELEMSGYSSQKTFENMVCTIYDLPVTIEDIQNANNIYGCDVPMLKVKAVHQQPKRVQTEYIEVTEILKERIGNLIVEYDVMFVNGILFLVSVFSFQFHNGGLC